MPAQKFFEETQKTIQFLSWLNQFRPPQNILGPFEGQGISVHSMVYCSNVHGAPGLRNLRRFLRCEISFSFSSRSLKTREKYISFTHFVYFFREVCLLFNFWMKKFTIMFFHYSKKSLTVIDSPYCTNREKLTVQN